MKRLLLPAILLILLAGIYISYCSAIDADRTLPNTTVNDTDISDMTFKEASDALEADARKRQKSSVFTVSYAGCDYTLSVGSALQMDHNAAAQEALRKSQTGFFLRGLTRLGARFTENHIQYPKMSTDAEEFHRILEESRILDKKNADPASYKIENEQLLITAKSAWKVDEEALMRELAAAIQTKDFSGTIECPLACDDLDNLERIYDELHTACRDASLDPSNDYAITESVTGVDFDKELAEKKLSRAKAGSTVAVELHYTEPEITTEDLKAHLFKDTLGTVTTPVGGSANSRTNISLAARKCDGIILLSGEEFSFNNTVGIQTAETGFKTADAILDGEIIQAYGGGICQVSTTIFAAALYANLKIVERWNHDYIARYIDAGLDAAVAWDALDMRIANDTPYPVRIDVDYSGSALTVTLLGTRTDDAVIEITTKTLDNPSDNLLEIVTYRNVYTEDMSQLFIEKVAHSVYEKSRTIN
ncbi:vancomycin B-type resistance protein VanW [Lachnospiraceae bacterium]|nr:vancomycin B-type resistance protein VanW [Lachnospiraceae bacterium]